MFSLYLLDIVINIHTATGLILLIGGMGLFLFLVFSFVRIMVDGITEEEFSEFISKFKGAVQRKTLAFLVTFYVVVISLYILTPDNDYSYRNIIEKQIKCEEKSK